MHHSNIASLATQQLNDPIQKMLETGIFHERDWFARRYNPIDDLVPEVTVRKIARKVAQEQKRPFIKAGYIGTWFEWRNRRWERMEAPEIEGGWIRVPKRKYLMPFVAPLIAGTRGSARRPWNARNEAREPGIYEAHGRGYWHFSMYDRTLYEEFLENALKHDTVRQALRLPDLGR